MCVFMNEPVFKDLTILPISILKYAPPTFAQ